MKKSAVFFLVYLGLTACGSRFNAEVSTSESESPKISGPLIVRNFEEPQIAFDQFAGAQNATKDSLSESNWKLIAATAADSPQPTTGIKPRDQLVLPSLPLGISFSKILTVENHCFPIDPSPCGTHDTATMKLNFDCGTSTLEGRLLPVSEQDASYSTASFVNSQFQETSCQNTMAEEFFASMTLNNGQNTTLKASGDYLFIQEVSARIWIFKKQ